VYNRITHPEAFGGGFGCSHFESLFLHETPAFNHLIIGIFGRGRGQRDCTSARKWSGLIDRVADQISSYNAATHVVRSNGIRVQSILSVRCGGMDGHKFARAR